ncbi:PKD domain-containing protein [Agriterribacter sp.]|nr:PKD domain-containing protein [Agriterribacter sp.]HRO48285.1 PKD domain-containing protein [Agriterribacter sp.]
MTPQPKHCLLSLWRILLPSLCCFVFHTAGIAQLNAFFNADKEGGCPPFTVQFSNASSGASANAAYLWNFGNGNTSELRDPAAIYTEEKEYTVTLTVTDEGKTSTYTRQITGYQKPVADFSVSATKDCIPAGITFTSSSKPGSGSLSRYYWDFGDGSTEEGYGNTISHTYMAVQKPSVSLTVTNSYGCYSTIEKDEVAEILPAMHASFTSDKRVLCTPSDAVQFTSISSGPGTLSYIWDFGDGNTSSVKNPSYSFNKKGIYTVSLTVKNEEGCSITTTQSDYLNVASYKAAFNTPALICEGQRVVVNSTSTPNPSSSNWYINDQPVYSWYNSLEYTFADTGKQTIKLVNTFGDCQDVATATVHVRPVPRPTGFAADIQSLCGAPSVVKFKDNTEGAVKWEWDFDYYGYYHPGSAAQAPSHTYTGDNSYFVNLTVSNIYGCSSGTGQYVTISKPYVNIYNKLSSGSDNWYCGYVKVQMAAGTATEEIIDYKWHFGDGATSTDPEPVHEYTKPGNFNVRLEYVTKNGCKGVSNSIDFSVYSKPKADFKAIAGVDICGNTPVTYSYTGTNFSYLVWSFEGEYNDLYYGNNGGRTVQYNKEGTYGVKLTAYNGNCSDEIEKKNYVTIKPPFPKITGYTLSCEGTRGLVKFTQASEGATSWKWDFGDGKTQTLASEEPVVEHEYTKTGSYKVVLTTSNGQCSVRDSITIAVLLKQKPVLALAPGEACTNTFINFSISNMEQNPYMANFNNLYYIEKWEYANGEPFEGSSYFDYSSNDWRPVRGSISSAQTKDNQLRVITTSYYFGCADTSNAVPVKFKGALPAFDVVKDGLCFTTAEVILKDASIAENNTITSWHWDFGDGQTLTKTSGGLVQHQYENPGNYYVKLTITDAGGCSSSTASYGKAVSVNGPKAAFSLAQGNNVPLNTNIIFYNSTNTYGADNVQYQWDFGDGSAPGNSYYESHTYTQPGTYAIQLTATDAVSGCTSYATQTLVVRYFNTAFRFTQSFVTNTQCAPVVASFENTSYDYTKIVWDFGDGSPLLENVSYPRHAYKEPGTYEIKLMGYGYNGLEKTFKDTIIISRPEASLKAGPPEICLGQQASLKAAGPGISSYAWDFGDGNVMISGDSSISHTYNSAGIYMPQLLITDAGGCTGAANAGDRIQVRPAPKLTVTPTQTRICLGESLQLSASTPGGVSYTWEAANGINHMNLPNPTVKPGLTTTYNVVAKDDLGCSATGSAAVTVVQPEQLKVQPDTGICYGKQVQLHVSGTTVYQWIRNTNGLSSIHIADPVAQPVATTVYTITGGDQYGCFSDTADIVVSVYDLPSVSAGRDVEVLAGTPVQLQADGTPDIVSWKWTPDQYLSCGNCPAPVSKALATTEYHITVTNAHGCTASDGMILKMQCEESKVHIPNAFTPNGDGRNDVFTILGISYVKHLVIYNRYGKKVFERRNYIAADRSLGWDGTFNGELLPTGSFVYFAEMECESGGIFTRKGTVTMIR